MKRSFQASAAPRAARSPFRLEPPSGGAQPWEIRALADGEAEILLYEEIGYWGIQAKDFVQALKAVDAQTIHLRVNSPGGSVFDGFAIYNALRDHSARVVAHVDGLAASIASVIALAADEVIIAENAFFMIHNPWTFAMGNAEELRQTAATLDKIGGSIVDTYVRASGATKAKVEAWMNDETWFTAQEALDAGFADTIAGDAPAEATDDVADRFDLSVFARTPEQLLAARARTGDASRAVPSKKHLERALREAGCSRSEATAIVARGCDALTRSRSTQREAGADQVTAEALQAGSALLAALTSAIPTTRST